MGDLMKSFERWFEADAMPLEHSNWFERDKDEPKLYEIPSVQKAWAGFEAGHKQGLRDAAKVAFDCDKSTHPTDVGHHILSKLEGKDE